ncbi:MAG: glycosyltransferase family 39 protein, partial [Anaerolineae bacterium]
LAVWAVRHSFLETTLWTAGDVHPPLYFWLLWPWVRLTGESEFAARYLTVLVGMLTIAAMAPLGRRLGGRAVGAAALGLLALSRFHVWWSQEMRMYALAALAATLSFYFLLRWVSPAQPTGRMGHRARALVGWIAATVAALYTIYFSALLLAIQNLYVFLIGLGRRDRWALWRPWLLAQAVALALWTPWLALALPRMRSWSVVQEPVSPGFVFLLDGVLLMLGISTHVERYLWAVLIVGGPLLWGTAALLHRARRSETLCPTAERVGLLALGTLIPPLMVWLVTQPRMLFYTPRVEARYFLSFAPLFYAWLAWALAALLARPHLRPLGAVAAAAVLLPMLWALPGHYADRRLRDDLQSMVRAIWAQAQPGDAVVLVSGDRYPVFLYYYDRAPAPADRPPVYRVPHRSPVLDAPGADAELGLIAEKHPRIWLAEVEWHLQDPQGMAEAWL